MAPSILAADFGRLGDEARAAEAAGADLLHVDVMDGHFVPNLTVGPPVVAALRRSSNLPFDVHLMVTNPARFVAPFATAGADHLTVHVESADDPATVLAAICAAGCSAGISLCPRTPAEAVFPYLKLVRLVLVMTVEPGFGGQAFMADMVPKIARIRQEIAATGADVLLEVDGGINPDTARIAVAAGADLLVAGTSVFHAGDGIAAGVARLRAAGAPRRD